MKFKSYLKASLFLTISGTLFSGYLSGIKLFEGTCAFNESCPYFLGYPACFFGFGLFTVLLVTTIVAVLKKTMKDWPAKMNSVVSGLGILFAGYLSYQDISISLQGAGMHYAFLLPTCTYGMVFFIIVFALSVMNLKKQN